MMRCVEGEKEGAWKLAIDREVVHAHCVWVGLRPTIDAELLPMSVCGRAHPCQMSCKAAPAFVQDYGHWPCDL